jgi:hypothetical protein
MTRLLGLLIASLFLASAGITAEPKDYQVTGPVLDVKEDIIIVQKGDEKWEIGRDKGTKIKGGDLKKGSRVTVHYKMTASSIDVKDGADAKSGTKTKGDDKKAASKTKQLIADSFEVFFSQDLRTGQPAARFTFAFPTF